MLNITSCFKAQNFSSYRLPVETGHSTVNVIVTGQYSNVPYDRRICQHCYLNGIRNET